MKISMKPLKQLLKDRGLEPNGKVQRFIDTEVVRHNDKYVPMRSGTLKKAVGTVYGSGKVKYCTPYAKENYYNNAGSGKQGTKKGGLRGRLWFERMKAVSLNIILDGVRKFSGAKRS